MDGIINILKPSGMTSADVVAWVRRTLHVKKVGHTGTLDPGVVGVLPVCLGQATRFAEFLTEQGKAYRAELTLGISTDTQDGYGQILTRQTPEVTVREFEGVLGRFQGVVRQTPPMYSAVRKDGKHLYEYARQGLEVERLQREVVIAGLKLERWIEGQFPQAVLDIQCSKGTYIRTLCHDIGQELGCGAHMSYLIRTRSGPFLLEDSWTLEEIEEQISVDKHEFLLPSTAGLELPIVRLPLERSAAFMQGLSTRERQVLGGEYVEGQTVQVWSDEKCLGVAIWRDHQLWPSKVLK